MDTAAALARTAEDPPVVASDRRRWAALAVLSLVQLMLVLDTSVVNVALPSIQRDLGFSASGLAWVVNGYTLMAGGFLLFGGRLSDLIGRRRLFLIGVTLFAGASLASGLAQNPGTLVAARFAQGLGEAIASPAALSLVVLLFPDTKERAKAIGAWGALAGLGGVLGVVIGGVITSETSWRWIFLINLPIAVAVLMITPRLIPAAKATGRAGIDFLGALLITGSLVAIVYGLLAASTHTWGSGRVLAPLGIGAGLLVAFIVSQALLASPLVPLGFFRNRTRVTANLATMLMVAAFFSMIFVLTLYMQDVGHYSPLRTGMAYVPFGLALLVGVVLSTQLLPRIGVKYGLVAAFLLGAGAMLLFGQIGTRIDYAGRLLPGMLLFSVGQGIMFPALQNAALHKVDHGDAGLGSGVQNTSLQVGGSLGLSVLVTTALRHANSLIAHGTAPITATVDGYVLVLRIAAAVMLAGALLIAFALEKVAFVPPDQQALAVANAEAGLDDDPVVVTAAPNAAD